MKLVGIDPSINGTGLCKFTLDDNFKIIKYDYLGFSTVKKHESNNIVCFRKKDFKNDIDQNIFITEHVENFIDGVDYISMEDYAFAATGRVFDIAEFVGGLKLMIYNKGIPLRMIEPTVVKKFATNHGNCDKISMEDEYMKHDTLKLDKDLPQYKSPKADIIDAYYITDLLRLEIMLRFGIVELKKLKQEEIEIFNRVTKANPVNVLARDFIQK
jgi:Holliday junction resolvasome RuvABC endonuclease subunit